LFADMLWCCMPRLLLLLLLPLSSAQIIRLAAAAEYIQEHLRLSAASIGLALSCIRTRCQWNRQSAGVRLQPLQPEALNWRNCSDMLSTAYSRDLGSAHRMLGGRFNPFSLVLCTFVLLVPLLTCCL
jgi:hypothetical protein